MATVGGCGMRSGCVSVDKWLVREEREGRKEMPDYIPG